MGGPKQGQFHLMEKSRSFQYGMGQKTLVHVRIKFDKEIE